VTTEDKVPFCVRECFPWGTYAPCCIYVKKIAVPVSRGWKESESTTWRRV